MSVIMLDASVIAISDKNATAAHIEIEDVAGIPIAEATGASKREQYDVYNETIAVDLAVGRALQKLGRQMVSRAHRAVRRVEAAKASERLSDEPIPYSLTDKGRYEIEAGTITAANIAADEVILFPKDLPKELTV